MNIIINDLIAIFYYARVCIMSSGITGNRYIATKCKLFMYLLDIYRDEKF